MNLREFKQHVASMEGIAIKTIGRRSQFYVSVDENGFTYTPATTGKPRVQLNKDIARLFDLFIKRGSLKSKDYTDDTRNSSYILALLESYSEGGRLKERSRNIELASERKRRSQDTRLKPWNGKEVEIIVADYFDMLQLELQGKKYNKTEHRRLIMSSLDARSHGSIDSKHMNISALMIELGLPYISGYKPLKNYQRQLLPDAVLDYLVANPKLQALLERDAEKVPDPPSVENILESVVAPPETFVQKGVREESSPGYFPTKRSFLEIEATNRKLGQLGEEFVLNFERARLIYKGKENLSDQIEHTSLARGDGAGYDIRSYNVDGSDRFIEAKTTKHGIETPFFISKNEVSFSQRHESSYFLYRVFDFRKAPRLYLRQGNVFDHFSLRPESYSARP